METKKYNTYSTDYKMAVISGKQIHYNYNNKYYWSTKGKEKIISALRSDKHSNLATIFENLNDVITNIINELFILVNKLIDSSNKIKKLFKKSRVQVVQIWELIKPYTSVENLCKWFRISESTYFNWKKRVACKVTYTKECPNIYPNQLRDWERRILEDDYFFNAKYANYSVSDLLGQVMADGKVIIGESLFYEYSALIDETKRRKTPRKTKNYKGLRATNAKDIIQMDKTKVAIKNTNGAWVNLIIDNRSRAILSFLVCFGSHSKYTPGRQFNNGNYRYGFNGKENDNEVKGTGNQQDYGFRIYDPRLGKFLSVDPLSDKYPFYTPYQFAGNKPIWATDLDGLEEKFTNKSGYKVSGSDHTFNFNPLYKPQIAVRRSGDNTINTPLGKLYKLLKEQDDKKAKEDAKSTNSGKGTGSNVDAVHAT